MYAFGRSACYSGDIDIDKNKITFVIQVHYSRERMMDNFNGQETEMPHLVLLDAIGSELKHFLFDAEGFKRCEEGRNVLHKFGYKLYLHTKCLFDVLRRVPSLETFYIRHVDFLFMFVDQDQLEGCKALTTLTIDHANINEDGFKQITGRFPSLTNFKLSHCRLNATNSIDMPESTLHNFIYEHDAADKIYFYIKEESGREYYIETDEESGKIIPCGITTLIRDNWERLMAQEYVGVIIFTKCKSLSTFTLIDDEGFNAAFQLHN